MWTNRIVGDVFGRQSLLVRKRRQSYISSLQEIFILVRFAQLHALRDPPVSKFLQEDKMQCQYNYYHMSLKIKRQLTVGSFPLFLNLESRSSVTFLVGMMAFFSWWTSPSCCTHTDLKSKEIFRGELISVRAASRESN